MRHRSQRPRDPARRQRRRQPRQREHDRADDHRAQSLRGHRGEHGTPVRRGHDRQAEPRGRDRRRRLERAARTGRRRRAAAAMVGQRRATVQHEQRRRVVDGNRAHDPGQLGGLQARDQRPRAVEILVEQRRVDHEHRVGLIGEAHEIGDARPNRGREGPRERVLPRVRRRAAGRHGGAPGGIENRDLGVAVRAERVRVVGQQLRSVRGGEAANLQRRGRHLAQLLDARAEIRVGLGRGGARRRADSLADLALHRAAPGRVAGQRDRDRRREHDRANGRSEANENPSHRQSLCSPAYPRVKIATLRTIFARA
jgi:hypothetical protein